MVSREPADLAELLTAVTEVAAQLGTPGQDVFDVVHSFLAGPPVVRVVGPPHAERAEVTQWLTAELPAVQIREGVPASPDPEPLWDVSVLVTPADRVLSMAEERYILDAAAGHRAVLVLVSRLSVLGNEAAQSEARRELELYRIAPLLKVRQIPWSYLGAPGDADLLRRIGEAALREGDHQRAVRAFLRGQADDLVGRATGLVAARRADQERFAQLRQRVTAQRASMREAVRTAVLGALDRLRTSQENVYAAAQEVASLTRAWLDGDGLLPWPDVEYPLRRSLATLLAGTERVGPGYQATVRADLARVEGMLADGLRELRLEPAGLAGGEVQWASRDFDLAVSRLGKADISPVLSAARERMQGLRDALREASEDKPHGSGGGWQMSVSDSQSWSDGPPGSGDGDGNGDGSGDRDAAQDNFSFRMSLGGLAPRRKPPQPDVEATLAEVDAMLTRFLDSYLRPRIGEVLTLADEMFPRVGAAMVDEAFAGIDRTLDAAEAELTERYAWSGAYARLVALRAQIG